LRPSRGNEAARVQRQGATIDHDLLRETLRSVLKGGAVWPTSARHVTSGASSSRNETGIRVSPRIEVTLGSDRPRCRCKLPTAAQHRPDAFGSSVDTSAGGGLSAAMRQASVTFCRLAPSTGAGREKNLSWPRSTTARCVTSALCIAPIS
jgi:hypothetical protein